MSFTIPPKILLLHGGEYMCLHAALYYSPVLKKGFQIPAGFVFSPSIPTFARIFVPVTSDIVAASLPHDFLYQTADQGVNRREADLVGKEELQHRNVNKHIILRFYYALVFLGWRAWNRNRKKDNG